MTEPCDLCDNSQRVDCLQCGGSGAAEPIDGPPATCPGCAGAGQVDCPDCRRARRHRARAA